MSEPASSAPGREGSGSDKSAQSGEDPIQTQSGAPPTASGTASISRRRLIFVDALIVLTTVLGVVGMLSVWANRLLFSPDNWSKTSTKLLQNNDIRTATANYVVAGSRLLESPVLRGLCHLLFGIKRIRSPYSSASRS